MTGQVSERTQQATETAKDGVHILTELGQELVDLTDGYINGNDDGKT